MAGFVIAGLSVVGVPPTCGFFSKWYLISGGIAAGQYGFVAALIFSSLVNAVLFFRIFEIALFEPFKEHHHGASDSALHTIDPNSHDENKHTNQQDQEFKEAPLDMLIPFLAVSILLVVLGLYSGKIITNIIHFAIPAGII